jgi:hypothetical protein
MTHLDLAMTDLDQGRVMQASRAWHPGLRPLRSLPCLRRPTGLAGSKEGKAKGVCACQWSTSLWEMGGPNEFRNNGNSAGRGPGDDPTGDDG